MMGRTEERLRDATAALGQAVRREDIPGLRLPEPTRQPARKRRPRLASQRRPQAAGRRRLSARAWLIPAGAAASVLALIGLVAVVGRSLPATGGRQCRPMPATGGRPSVPPAAAMPAYLVTAVDGKGYVRTSATGRILATIRPPAPIFALEGVAAAPGDRTFYLAGAALAPHGARIEFFRLILGANGRPGAMQRLPGLPYLAPLPITSNALTTIALAVSPDGKELAYASGSQFPDSPGSTQPAGTQGIVVQNVATGARHSWSAWPASHSVVSSLSWASGGLLGFVATVGDAAVSNGAVRPQPGNQLNVFMVLNTAACGSGLISDSRLVAYGSSTVKTADAATPLPGPNGGVISQDGRSVYARINTQQGAGRLVAISVATGKVTRVLLSGPQAADPAVLRGGLGAADPAPMSIDGTSLLFPLSLPHPPLRTSGKNYVIGHLARIDLATGTITRLPFPLYYGTMMPVPPVGAAW